MKLIESTEVIAVERMPIVIYGPPGAGKTSIAQTGPQPSLTLDFDEGIHRSFNRKAAGRFSTWAELNKDTQEGAFRGYASLVVDTLGRMIDLMIPAVIAAAPKNSYNGNLSPQGYGVLGGMFGTWVKTIRQQKCDLIMIAHQDETTDAGGNPYFKPELPGKMAWKEIHKFCDLIARVKQVGNRRILDFNPSENAVGKNAAAFEDEEMLVPRLETSKTFLADLLALAKTRVGRIAEEHRALAAIEDEWRQALATDPPVDALNGQLPALGKIENQQVKARVKDMIGKHAKAKGWHFDKATAGYVAPSGREANSPADYDAGDAA
jgi:hypothetical protein